MSDFTANADLSKVKRLNRVEYFVYFALLFSVAILPHLVGWLYQVARHGKLPKLGPITRALKDARAVVPMIFCG